MQLVRYHKLAFALSWMINAVLWLLVLFVLAKCFLAPVSQPFGVMLSFGSFVVFFVLFTVSIFIHWRTWTFISLIFTIIFMVGQFICVLVTTITIFSDERILEKIYFSNNPAAWVTNHRWLPILFFVVFVPVFLIQVYIINFHSQSPQQKAPSVSDEHQRKGTPYYSQQNDYMPAETTE